MWRNPFRRGASSAPSYTLLTGTKKPMTITITFTHIAFFFIAFPGCMLLAFRAGKEHATSSKVNSIHLTSSPQTFKFQPGFSGRPNITSDKAWLDLFPMQGGFFKHPKLAPERATFATFHQLHCLDSIRHAYWSLHDAVLEGKAMTDKEMPHHASPHHVKHCIDLLRQALMCQPDLTVEVSNDALGGVTGFGTEHSCVDWQALVKWTSEWETFEQYAPEETISPTAHRHDTPTHDDD